MDDLYDMRQGEAPKPNQMDMAKPGILTPPNFTEQQQLNMN